MDMLIALILQTAPDRLELAVNGGGSAETERAVEAGLRWLSLHQNADGSWGSRTYVKRCPPNDTCGPAGGFDEWDAGVSALAVLAFLRAGYAETDTVRDGLRFLLTVEDVGPKPMYTRAVTAWALAEAYGRTKSPRLRDGAARAVDLLLAAQNPGKGWRYTARGGDNDSSVTGWALAALRAAERAGLRVPAKAFDGGLAWIEEATGKDGLTGYNRAGTGKVFLPGM